METKECIKSRRSIRSFKNTLVSREIIQDIVKTASYAPSWKNTQIVRYVVVEDPELLERIAMEGTMGFTWNQKIIQKAPQLVVLTYITGRCGYEKDGSFSTPKEDRWEMFDAGIAAQTFALAAHDQGVGSVIMGIFDEGAIGNILEIPENQKIGAILAIGYLDIEPSAPARKEVETLVCFK